MAEAPTSQDSDVPPRLAVFARVAHLCAAALSLVTLVSIRLLQEAEMTTLQALTFYGVPAGGLFFFLLAARARPALRLKLLLLVGAIVAGLYSGEVALRLVSAPRQWEGVAAELGDPDTRTKLEVVRDLKAEGRRAFAEYSPWLLRDLRVPIDSVGVIPIAPTPSRSTAVACQEGEGWIIYESDEHGFRGGGEWQAPARVAVLGDSFVAGRCVGEGRDIPGRLRRRWPSTRNLGVAGAGPLHELAVLREFGPVLRPSVVVWVYFEGNDPGDLASEMASPLMTRYLDPGFRIGLPERQEEVDRHVSRLLDSIYEARLADESQSEVSSPPALASLADLGGLVRLRRLRAALGFGINLPRADPLRDVPEIVRLGRDTAKEWGGRLVLVYLPSYARFGALIGDSDVGQRREYLEMADDLGLPVVDLVEVFAQEDDPESLWIHPRGHLSSHGYSVAASAIADTLERVLADEGGT